MPNSYDSRTPTEAQQQATEGAPGGVLGELMLGARARAAVLRPQRAELEREASKAVAPPSMVSALNGRDVAVIAEIKRASPSKGTINTDLDPRSQAIAYATGGAVAISILTEPSRFHGSLGDLEIASGTVDIPLLRKDFIVAEEQVLEARIAGASAVLLIARGLPRTRLLELAAFSRGMGVEPLIEIRTSRELADALSAGALLVGINARDLESLEIDESLVPRLAPLVPGDCICIAESGLRTRDDVERVASYGADAVLVGSSLSASPDPTEAVRALTGVARRRRAASD